MSSKASRIEFEASVPARKQAQQLLLTDAYLNFKVDSVNSLALIKNKLDIIICNEDFMKFHSELLINKCAQVQDFLQ